MLGKLKPGSRAFILIVAAVAVAVIMALGSAVSPDAAAPQDMVTAAPRTGLGGGSELLPNCIRCGGTDCVVWLPEGADVTADCVSGSTNGIQWAVLTTTERTFTDEIRNSVMEAGVTGVPGTGSAARVTYSAEGYAGRESACYEEMRVREKVSLHTRNGYYFTYLLRTPNGTGVVVTASCDGSGGVDAARSLLYSIATSFQRGDEQDLEVRGAIWREATTGNVQGIVSEEDYDLEEYGYDDGGADQDLDVVLFHEDDADGLLSIDAGFDLQKDVPKGGAVVVSWTNKTAAPAQLFLVSPSGAALSPDEEQSLDGSLTFWVTGEESARGWRMIGRTARQLGDAYPIAYSAEEYANAFWN